MSKPPKSSPAEKSSPTKKASPAKKPADETAKPKKAGKVKAEKVPKTDSRVEPETDGVRAEAEQPVVAKPVAGKAKAPAKPSIEAPVRGDPALLKRLEEMTDFQLRAYQTSTERISRDTRHVKSGAAKATLALIEAEVARRKVSPGRAPSPVRAAVASPKPGKK